MPFNIEAADIYRREASRLRAMAESDAYSLVSGGLLAVARQYDVLASQAQDIGQHEFGRPLRRAQAAPPPQLVSGDR